MSPQEPLGPFCQSCSMPLTKAEDFGTGADGHRVNDYCRFCYRDGAFMNPGATMEQMINQCVGIMARQGLMSEGKARTLLTEVMPGLKRWQEVAGQPVLQTAGDRGLSAGDAEC